MNSCFVFDGNVSVTAHADMNNATVQKLWKSFCLGDGSLTVTPTDRFVCYTAGTMLPSLPADKEYALRVEENGFAVVGRDYGGLMRGVVALLLRFEYEPDHIRVKVTDEVSHYKMENRMIHLCVFPENDLHYMKKLVRLCAMCQYTHVVIEFWGMLQFDCLKELAWPQAFTKDETRELIREARDLGMEPVPMFNHLGHAACARVLLGKHVVLDQNPRLQYLFTPDGWVWDFRRDEVRTLLKAIRQELYDLFGEGSYLHLGCDEAYYVSETPEMRAQLPSVFADFTAEVEAEGRRPMIWMDMLLEKGKYKDCYTAGHEGEVLALQEATSPSTVFVDWQYDCMTAPIPTLVELKDRGRDCIGAPFFEEKNYAAHVETIEQHNLFGIMFTTWHTLRDKMPTILDCARKCGMARFVWDEHSGHIQETAVMLRRVSFEGNSYEDCGWAKEQIDV